MWYEDKSVSSYPARWVASIVHDRENDNGVSLDYEEHAKWEAAQRCATYVPVHDGKTAGMAQNGFEANGKFSEESCSQASAPLVVPVEAFCHVCFRFLADDQSQCSTPFEYSYLYFFPAGAHFGIFFILDKPSLEFGFVLVTQGNEFRAFRNAVPNGLDKLYPFWNRKGTGFIE